MSSPFNKVVLNLPAVPLGGVTPLEHKPVVSIDDKPVHMVQAVSIDCTVGDNLTLVTVSFLAKVEGEVFVLPENLKKLELKG